MELVALFICDRLWQQVYAQISFSEKTLNFYIDEPSLFSYNSLCAKRLRCISFRFSRVSRMGFTSRSFVRMGNRKTSRMYKYWPQTFLNCLYVCDSPFPSLYLHLFCFISSKTMSSCTFIKNSLSVMLQWQEEHAMMENI